MNRTSDKLRRGTSWMYEGKQVWVERQKTPTQILISYTEERDDPSQMETVSIDDLKPVNEARKPISKFKKLTKEERGSVDELKEFFDQQALSMPMLCMNCNRILYANNQFAKRCVTAHILPKAEFETLKLDPDNIVFMGAVILGGCDCHDNYDRKGTEYRSKMPIYPLVLQRFHSKLKHKLNSKDYIKACEYLNIDWQ